MKYVIYSEIRTPAVERWFYGEYATREEANEVALDLNRGFRGGYCVCREDAQGELNVRRGGLGW